MKSCLVRTTFFRARPSGVGACADLSGFRARPSGACSCAGERKTNNHKTGSRKTDSRKRLLLPALLLLLTIFCCPLLTGCGDGGGSAGGGGGFMGGGPTGGGGTTSGDAFSPGEVRVASFDANVASSGGGASIDTSHVSDGYVGASCVSESRLKLTVSKDGVDYNYDMPGDGTPAFGPINMGDGHYIFSVMQNTRDSLYALLWSVEADVILVDEFAPFLHPNVFCNYNASSAVVEQAKQLTSEAQNQGDALRSVYDWVVGNVTYDTNKAATVEKGYIPNPDSTLSSKTGICFDYASLAAAMLRSLGIPCKIITGYVSSGTIYHAWNMVYINGTWEAIGFQIPSNTWSRIDTTFAAGGASDFVGDGGDYSDSLSY